MQPNDPLEPIASDDADRLASPESTTPESTTPEPVQQDATAAGNAVTPGVDLTEHSTVSPYASIGFDAEPPVDNDLVFVSLEASRPRWWTSLAVPAVSLFVFILFSTIMTLVAFIIVHGDLNIDMLRDPGALRSVTESRLGLFILVVIPQFSLVIPSIIAAMLSPVATQRRLGLIRGHWPLWAWFAAAFATPLIGLASSVVIGLFMTESENLKMMSEIFREHGQSGFLIPLALMIGATPAICEELLFRGYVQTRLTRSFSPAVGILIASFLFAVFHMDLVHVIAVFPLGLFLGFVTWRSGSLFPAMIGHFINNVISVVAVVLAPADKTDVLAIPAAMVSIFILGLGMIGIVAVVGASVQFGRPPSHDAVDSHDADVVADSTVLASPLSS